jgi:hypothetical protein
MKMIVSVLVESPFYFTLPLPDRFELVRRLKQKEQHIDLSDYQTKVNLFLNTGEPGLAKSALF